MPTFTLTVPPAALLQMIAAAFIALSAGTVARLRGLRRADDETRATRLASLRTWWIICVVVSLCLLAGQAGVCLLMAAVSGLALWEFVKLTGERDRVTRGLLGCVLAANYGLLMFGQVDAFFVFVPLVLPVAAAIVPLLRGQPDGFIRRAGGTVWGGLLLIYGLSHSVLVYSLPQTQNGPAGAAGWFLYLVLLTELNDISQAFFGRRFGAHKKHRIAPVISPNKTWEGFLGGSFVTITLASLLAPWLTTLATGERSVLGLSVPGVVLPPVVGLLIAVAGFFGDISMSAVKRDVGVKDSSAILPGMGGMIDRIDSLSWTAPAFIYFATGLLR